jgi:transketolase
MYEDMELRQVLAMELDKMLEKDERIIVIDADLARANGTLELRDKYPEKAFDIGVCEANMAGVAAGMSSYGFIPFIVTFTPFATRRICDQIAISISYAKRNVKIIGTDPGICAEYNGGTHMSVEDIGVLRSIPNIVIYEPADAVQLVKSLPKIVEFDGLIYMRLPRKYSPSLVTSNYEFDLFKVDLLREGRDVTLLATGIMVEEAIRASDILKAEGIMAEVINVHTIKPIDKESIIASAKKTGAVVTCENHNIIGGLRSAVAEVLTEESPVPIKAIGIQDHFGEVGEIHYLKQKFRMLAEDIADAAIKVIRLKKFNCSKT